MTTRRRRAYTLAAAAAFLAAAGFWKCLPETLFDVPTAAVLLARDGTLLGARIASDAQWRFPVIEHVPEKFETAIVAFEDKRFHVHHGVDPLALARAIYLNVTEGAIVSGASTLTMQVIRLARRNRERSYHEKVVESELALRLELELTKDEILALYASHAPFGGNVVGLEAASWRYFGRAPDELSWAESASLAVLPNRPALIHPGRNREELLAKRDGLLRKLHDNGALEALDLELALREPLPSKPRPLPQAAPHLLDTLRARAGNGTHRFETTIDPSIQIAASAIVREHARRLARKDIHNAAAIVVDNVDFEVLAYIGNASWSSSGERGHAVDVIRRPRSSGSILKPFLFAAMLDAGEILPGSLVPDVPTHYGGYVPENYDHGYRGAVPAKVALARSLNVPAVRMLKRHGVGRFQDFLTHMGMTTLDRSPDHYGLTLILGGAETTLWDLAAMYANLAETARRRRPSAGTTYRTLKLASEDETRTERSAELSPGAAWLTLDALVEVARPGDARHWREFASARRVGWKTGTSYGHRDGWAIGTTPRHTVAVWVGNASGEGRPALTGTATAAPILFDILNRLISFDDARWFEPPYLHMKQVEVCKNDGFLAAGDCETRSEWIPKHSHFDRVSPYHQRVHLDSAGRKRVHGACEAPGAMTHRSWFVLPARLEHYYRKHHADYRRLPAYREDCRLAGANDAPIAFLYPNHGARLYIPMDLGQQKGRTIFEAVHRDQEATLFWHLDERYLGSTTTFHQQALDITPGAHVVTVVDQLGNRLARRFEILSAQD